VCAELAALGGIEAALEEGAEDGGIDGRPIELGGGDDVADFIGGKFENPGVLKESAVEVGDGFQAEVAAGGPGSLH
jgi:hypothetical protein